MKKAPIPPEKFAQLMREYSRDLDTEKSHVDADELMCHVLRALGYAKGVKVFESMSKWYA